MTTENYIETEIKIQLTDMNSIRQKIFENNFKIVSPHCFEHNILLDTEEHTLKKNKFLLRLRRIEGRNILTFKRPPAHQLDSLIYKVEEEIEVDVTDFSAALAIFKGLGYRVFFIYEKYREIFDNGSVKIMLDHTPVGDFMEIEGTPLDIDRTALLLGYNKEDYIIDNYLTLFRKTHTSGHMQFKSPAQTD